MTTPIEPAVPSGRTRWAFQLLLLAAFALCGAAGWTIFALERNYHDAVRLGRVETLADRVVLFDYELTANATLAAASGDPAWRDKYEATSREFHRVWPEFVEALHANGLGGGTTEAHAADVEMERIERNALALADEDRGDAAMAQLDSAYYRATKEVFDAAMAKIEASIAVRVRRDREAADRRSRLLITACLILLPLFGSCWALAFASLRSYLRRRNEAERQLREREQRFAIAARATKDVLYDWDMASNVVQFSEALRTELGHAEFENIPASVWSDNIHPADVQPVLQKIHNLVEGDAQSWSMHYRFRRGDGTYAHVLDRGYMIRNEAGRPVRIVGAMLDMTEHKRNEAELRHLNAELVRVSRKSELILNAAADGIVGLDGDGRASFVNTAAAEILGFTEDELRGQRFHDLMHHSRADGSPRPYDDCEISRALTSGERTFAANDLFWRHDGSPLAVEYSATPMRGDRGEILGAVLTFRDTTEKLAVQRMKDEFVSTVSHELRTPLTSIRGALGLLAGGLLAKSPEKGQRMLDIAVSNTDRLVRLINDILDIERMDSGEVVLAKSRCRPAALLQSSIDVMRPLAEKAGVALELGTVVDATIWADTDRIIQTLTNLISNAIKFSPSGAKVEVSAVQAGDAVVFRVADQGRGIPKDKLQSIFDRFQQVDASDSREKGGSGLGLTICRGIVAQHGGELQVDSTVGVGSTFSFSLPAARVEAAPAPRMPRVIVCDDDEPTRRDLEALLRGHGYDALAVGGGEELLRTVPSFAPDVILLDIFMPRMSGWEALAELKSDETTAAIPVVILSGLAREEASSAFDLAGWVSKPLDPAALFATLDGAIDEAGRRPRILVVEDDFDLARVIIESLERHGVETLHAATGREAIEMTANAAPDLLVLDLVLPELDGFAVVEWLRDREQLRKVPLVVYSAADPTAAERQRLTLGATHFLTKSRVPPQEFEERVVALLDSMTGTKGAIADVA